MSFLLLSCNECFNLLEEDVEVAEDDEYVDVVELILEGFHHVLDMPEEEETLEETLAVLHRCYGR